MPLTVFDPSIRAKVAAMEASADVPNMDLLLAQRAALVERLAPLRAEYGEHGTWKERRDNLYALIAIEKRTELEGSAPMVTDSKGVSKPRPVTEPMVDAAVRTDDRYKGFLDEAERKRAQLTIDENAIDDVTKMMYWINALAKCRANEPAL